MQTKHRFNKLIVVILMASGSVAFADQDESSFHVENGVLEVGPDHTPFDSITPEARAAALPNLRAVLDSANSELRAAIAGALLRSDDRQTVAHLVERYRDGNDSGAEQYLGSYGNEAVIPYVIGDIYRDPGKIVREPSGAPMDIRIESTFLVLGLIQESKEFPEATKTWARTSAVYFTVRGRIRPVIDQEKQWWEHNKEAILDGQYQKATWLPATTLDVGLPKQGTNANKAPFQ